jgi:hypothetical protein
MASRRKFVFLVDYCVHAEVSHYLSRLRKVKVVSFMEARLTQNSDDTLVIERATQAGALLITSDKRFTETHVPLCSHEGIIKFGVRPTAQLRILKKFLKRSEKHYAWKGVTYLLENQFEMRQHIGTTSSIPY